MGNLEGNLLIRGATVIRNGGSEQSDVLVENGKISRIESGISVEATAGDVVEAEGLCLIPGVVDDQVHFRSPGLEHKEDLEHATRACAKGGVTSFLEMPNTNPTTTSVEALDAKLEMASSRCLVNYGFYIGATAENVAELQKAKRTPGIKIFIGSSTGNLLVDKQQALETIFAETELPICAHCEDETTIRENEAWIPESTNIARHSQVRDHRAAMIATKRATELAVRHKHAFHVLHLSTVAEVEVVQAAKPYVTSEVCPHHLFFNVDDYSRLGSRIKMNPSIKNKEDNIGLWNALCDGKIDVVATDHAPHTLEEKAAEYPKCPSGLPAVENYLALMLNQVAKGLCSIEQVVEWMCVAPSKIWSLKNKGAIEVGYDADLVLVDLELQRTVLDSNQLTKCQWTPWHGETLTGWPVQTWVHGRSVYRYQDGESEWVESEPLGKEIEFAR